MFDKPVRRISGAVITIAILCLIGFTFGFCASGGLP